MTKRQYKARKAELDDQLAHEEIDLDEYKTEWNAAETSFGVTPTTWPC